MALIDPGRKAPNFALFDHHGKPHSLKDYAGRTLILYFYPKDDTSDCTTQACQFRDAHPDFSHIKASVLGISPDDARAHAAFADKHALNFPMLVDRRSATGTPKTCDAFGTWVEKSMYGKKYMGVVRTTYLIAPDGKVARRWDKVKVTGHGAEVLAAAKALHSGELIEPKPPRNAAGKLATRTKSTKAPKAKPTSSKRSRTRDSNPQFTPIRGSRTSAAPQPAKSR
jgi:thioredoxin-dependent peroxiredoxin